MQSATIANGLRIVLVHDPRATDVQVTMRYRVGSIDDPVGQEGMAHLVEHLMFQQVLGSQSVFAKLQDAASFFNAFTAFEATTYIARARPERLDELLSIEAVRVGLRCASITDSVFAREREVVANELRQNDAASEAWRVLHEGMYPDGHPYRRGFADTVESVSTITREQACAFADAHYAPSNAVLVVSGDVTPQRLDQALGKFLGRVAKREAKPRTAVPRAPIARRATIDAPVDEEALVLAWPLPADPGHRAKMTTVARATVSMVSDSLAGGATLIELGDVRAPMLGIVVAPGEQKDVMKAIEAAIAKTEHFFKATRPAWLGEVIFDQLQQGAIYRLFSNLEEGSDRDTQFAASVLAGRDPSEVLAAETAALRSLSPEEARQVARVYLGKDRMSVLTLKPRSGAKHGIAAKLAAPIHDTGLRRDVPEPEEAKQPYADPIAVRALSGMLQRTLPNGLRVVLLPVTSVPTVEVRLVFGSGTADEPEARRGAALAAGHALDWNPRHLNDLLLFAAGGGTVDVSVRTDTTAFTARGLDMHLDFLLAGLRRWVRDGRYHVDSIEKRSKKSSDDEDALSDAWRMALYGARHPYVVAGVARHISPDLTVDDAERFRAAHYTPTNATLVIAGRFDAVLAQRWIDYLFADWAGPVATPATIRASLQAASIAKDENLAQTHVRIEMPAARGGRAKQLVVANMLDQITYDVRHQLGASYGFDASLAEARLSTTYVMDGRIDASRTPEAIELVRARIEALRTDPDAAARAFVAARKRVITQLRVLTGSASELAASVQRDFQLARPPLSDAQTAAAVQQLTIDQMADAFEDLDLARAAIFMRGPTADIDRAFAVLGRTATRVAPTDGEDPNAKEPSKERHYQDFEFFDIEEALTAQGPPRRLTFGVFGGPGTARMLERNMTGYGVAGEVGYRYSRQSSVGAQLSFGSFDGSYEVREMLDRVPVSAQALQLTGYLQASAYDRLWGGVFAGFSGLKLTDGDASERRTSVVLGVKAGVDVIDFRDHRLSIFGRVDSELFSAASYRALTLGLGYRY